MTQNPNEDKIREHSYDGIQEFDKNLPNWWLFTLYGTIVFSVAYWIFFHKSGLGDSQEKEFEAAMAEIESRIAQDQMNADVLDDTKLWAMSKDATMVAEGKTVYDTFCMSCHGPSMEGGIGVNLVDSEWLHGGAPMQVRDTIIEGVPAKGMIAWMPVIGEEKINSVTAFIMSHHEP